MEHEPVIGPLDRGRSRRVCLLLTGVIAASIADTWAALVHLRGRGLLEANPVAAWVIETFGSAAALTLFKVLTVGLCVILLFAMRRRLQAEIGAWVAILILGVMAWHWYGYAHALRSIDLDAPAVVAVAASEGRPHLGGLRLDD